MTPLPASFCMTDTVVRWYISSSLGPSRWPREKNRLEEKKLGYNQYHIKYAGLTFYHDGPHCYCKLLMNCNYWMQRLFIFTFSLDFTVHINVAALQSFFHVTQFKSQTSSANLWKGPRAKGFKPAFAGWRQPKNKHFWCQGRQFERPHNLTTSETNMKSAAFLWMCFTESEHHRRRMKRWSVNVTSNSTRWSQKCCLMVCKWSISSRKGGVCFYYYCYFYIERSSIQSDNLSTNQGRGMFSLCQGSDEFSHKAGLEAVQQQLHRLESKQISSHFLLLHCCGAGTSVHCSLWKSQSLDVDSTWYVYYHLKAVGNIIVNLRGRISLEIINMADVYRIKITGDLLIYNTFLE